MPFQGLPWTEFISCPVCFKLFNERQQRPISLGCGHTVCKSCIRSKLNDNRCPFDQIVLPSDVDKLPANFALMHLVGAAVPEQEKEAVKKVSDNPKSYEQARKCIEEMAVHLKPLAENTSDDDSSTCSEPVLNKGSQSTTSSGGNVNNNSKCVLSRPMQRKLISLIHCQLLEEEGRSRASRIARSLGERIVSELLVLQQYPHQLSANLWAAVRTRGCQFLGPAMQEEVLKLILLALEDGSFLSRKVLVLFVVQRLESRYPQASKTAIGHVVQLLYRASCFKVLKREEESSLMQLKEEFRQYESLRREHDSQIVQIAIEAGLRISPEQWSSLLYGDPAHKSHMQSIIDKHQSPQSFAQSISELMLTLQRSVDHSGLQKLQPQLEFLSNIDPSPDCPAPSWENLEAIMRSLNTVMTAFVDFLSNPDHRSRLETAPIQNTRYKTSMCRDFSARGTCPRGNTCTFAHSQEELERYRSRSRRNGSRGVAGLPEKTSSSLTPSESDQLRQVQFKSLGLTGKSKSVLDLMTPKSTPCLPSQDIVPLMNKMTPGSTTLIPHTKISLQSAGTTAPIDFRVTTKKLDPEKPPFIPPSSPHITPTRMTFSHPSLDVSECPGNPMLVPPACFHPHTSGFHPHSPQIHTSRPSSPYPGSSALPPFSIQSFTPGSTVRYSPPQISNSSLMRRAAPLSSPSVPARPPVCPSFVDSAMAGIDPLCGASVPGVDLCSHAGHFVLPYGVQGGTLEDLTLRKQEIISHFQDEQLLIDPGVASISAGGYTTGLAGLKTVLGNNKTKRDTMPSHVSDMFVATRTTQSLEELMNDDMSQYPNRWSSGEDIGLPLTNDPQYELSSTRGPLPDSSTTNSISFSMAVATSTANKYDTAANPKLYNSLDDSGASPEAQNLPPSTSVGDSEFSSFPGDDGDESFIPFEHTSVSKFGPISRMSRVKLHNSAPVQVTADSFKQMTPVLAVTPMDRPVSTSIAVPSRFPTPSLIEGVELAVKPTPSEIPSVWNKPPQMSYHNLPYMKSGSEVAMSHNEKLAYELQAIEYEISMKTGRDPEPLKKMIHEAVMASSQNTSGLRAMTYPPCIDPITCDNQNSSNGFGSMMDSVKIMKSGERLVPQHMAAQCFMDEYNRSRQGGGKM